MREIIEITCVNGETVNVSPLPPMLQGELTRKANAKYPPVDKAQYEAVDPNAFVPGEKIPAENNPAYQQALIQRNSQINIYLQELFIKACVQVPNRQPIEIVAEWRDRIDHYRSVAETSDVDDYTMAIMFGYLTTDEDLGAMLRAARKDLPLTQEEVIEGVRWFRHSVQRRIIDRSSRNAATQGIQKENGAARNHVKQPL